MEVRKASELKTLDELNLSNEDKEVLNRIIEGWRTLDGLVYYCRVYLDDLGMLEMFAGKSVKITVWHRLYRALDEAGFIRHDISKRSLRMEVFLDSMMVFDSEMGMFLGDMRKYRNETFHTNEEYEQRKVISEEGAMALIKIMKILLGKDDYEVLMMYYGLDGNKRASDDEIKRFIFASKSREKLDALDEELRWFMMARNPQGRLDVRKMVGRKENKLYREPLFRLGISEFANLTAFEEPRIEILRTRQKELLLEKARLKEGFKKLYDAFEADMKVIEQRLEKLGNQIKKLHNSEERSRRRLSEILSKMK